MTTANRWIVVTEDQLAQCRAPHADPWATAPRSVAHDHPAAPATHTETVVSRDQVQRAMDEWIADLLADA